MFKLTNHFLSIALISACSLAPAMADVIDYGERQDTTKGGFHVVSNAEWINRYFGRVLHLTALRDSLPPGNQPQSYTARAALVLDFTQEAPNGLPINYLAFRYERRRAGTIFKETTLPVVRVQYRQSAGFDGIKTLPLRITGYDSHGFATVLYDASDLRNEGLDPAKHITILRIAVVAKPKINPHIDDFASVDVRDVKYRQYLSQEILSPVDNLTVRDGNDDELLNGA